MLVLIIGMMVSYVLSVSLHFSEQTAALLSTGEVRIGEHIVTIDKIVDEAPPRERRHLADLADTPALHVSWTLESAIDEDVGGDRRTNALRNALIRYFGEHEEQAIRLRYVDEVMDGPWQNHLQTVHKEETLGATLMVSLQATDVGWLNFAAPIETSEPFWSWRFVLALLVMLLAVTVLSALVVHHLTKPLAIFARASHQLGVNVNAPPIPENGPAEVRSAARAFNEMQERIRRFIEDRTRMIAAISHDLGTPITRLRLRAEFVEDKGQQHKMLADLDDIQRMVASALAFARDDNAVEPRMIVDVRTLLQRVCDDVSDTGKEVSITVGNAAVPYACRPAALRRALTNLIENAVKYGQRARVLLEDHPDSVLITIDDDGPGIPTDLREEAFKPFRRLESSRSRETGGTGLGLTVARTIIFAHGGDVELTNRNEGGLKVEVRLPR